MKTKLIILALSFLSLSVTCSAYTHKFGNNTDREELFVVCYVCKQNDERRLVGIAKPGETVDGAWSEENCAVKSVKALVSDPALPVIRWEGEEYQGIEATPYVNPYRGFSGDGTWTVVERPQNSGRFVVEKTE